MNALKNIVVERLGRGAPGAHGVAHGPLPAAYRILPHEIDFSIPGFAAFDQPDHKVLAVSEQSCAAWYDAFVARLVAARGRTFLPVARMSDGEFLFALGAQTPDPRRPFWQRTAARCMQIGRMIRQRGNFSAGAVGRYHSGAYSRREWQSLRAQFAQDMAYVARHGALALHLSYGRKPFQEVYFPPLRRWLDASGIDLTPSNYVPFYFVYAALTGPWRRSLLAGRVLVVNGATGAKRDNIIAGLRREGATDVHWCSISDRRSLLDRIDITPFLGKIDVALVGAGIGKGNILRQMESLAVPCIDAGFVFEVWADPARAQERAFCLPDAARSQTIPLDLARQKP